MSTSSDNTSEQLVTENIKQFVEEVVEKTKNDNPKWGEVFANCFLDTLTRTIRLNPDGSTFILTGDIPAMWLRDSTAQIRPYLFLLDKEESIYKLISGVVELQFKYINIDPYANAFNQSASGAGHQSDHTDMQAIIWERKYEIDSLAYPVQLAYLLYKNSGKTAHLSTNVKNGIEKIIDTWIVEQNHHNSPYTFVRDTSRKEDTLARNGRGSEVAYTGMTWSGFRPSDDSCTYHYLVPSNMFAVVVLGYIQEMSAYLNLSAEYIAKAKKLQAEIEAGINNFAIVKNSQGQAVYAYEVDGLNNYSITDDPNVPDLLSIPYLGYRSEDDEIYQNTRATILSSENPYYYSGKYAAGLGSSHTKENFIWPIALSMEGLTTSDRQRQKELLNLLVNTDAGTLHMHESFDVNNPQDFSREWFSWSNMMFCELLLKYYGWEIVK